LLDEWRCLPPLKWVRGNGSRALARVAGADIRYGVGWGIKTRQEWPHWSATQVRRAGASRGIAAVSMSASREGRGNR
jgi:hypothetical protein